MWTSDPPSFPSLTEDECNKLVMKARIEKGRTLFQQAYAKQAKGIREFPTFDAKTFREFVVKRGNARAEDMRWKAGKFAVDTQNEAILKLLCLYFTSDERFAKLKPDYDLHKGIFLSGSTGVGKTVLMQLCSTNPHVCYSQHDCQVIAEEYAAKDGGTAVIDKYSANTNVPNTDHTFGQPIKGRFFDDLGQEDIAKHFGNERNVMGVIIENRYRAAGQFHLTHFTSNHTIDEIANLYGARVADRLREMCNVIEYPATALSRR